MRISEFPVYPAVAERAAALGLHVTFGAPNILRRRSASGNVSARELIGRGHADIICSGYSAESILQALFTLVNPGICDLPSACAMTSRNPAQVLGIDTGTGALQAGKRADFVIVDTAFPVPRILHA